MEEISVAVAPGESATVPAGAPILAAKASRALEPPPEVLMGRHIIGSAIILAGVVPLMTTQTLTADLDDLQLRWYNPARRHRENLYTW